MVDPSLWDEAEREPPTTEWRTAIWCFPTVFYVLILAFGVLFTSIGFDHLIFPTAAIPRAEASLAAWVGLRFLAICLASMFVTARGVISDHHELCPCGDPPPLHLGDKCRATECFPRRIPRERQVDVVLVRTDCPERLAVLVDPKSLNEHRTPTGNRRSKAKILGYLRLMLQLTIARAIAELGFDTLICRTWSTTILGVTFPVSHCTPG